MALLSINVERGFQEHWCSGFLAEYGPDAEFPKALSDHYTIKLSKMMDKRGDLKPNTKLALFSNEDAVAEVGRLEGVSKEIRKFLYKEAFGTAALGTIEQAVNVATGESIFKDWLFAFEAGDFAKCEALVSTKH